MDESTVHLMAKCSYAEEVWNLVMIHNQLVIPQLTYVRQIKKWWAGMTAAHICTFVHNLLFLSITQIVNNLLPTTMQEQSTCYFPKKILIKRLVLPVICDSDICPVYP